MKRNTLLQAFILLLVLYSLSGCTHTKSLASTFWRYTDEDSLSYELLLKPDGHIYSYHPNDATPENDFWKQKGKRITFTMNDSYAVYKGKLINDSTLSGKAHSPGFEWKWTAKFVTNN